MAAVVPFKNIVDGGIADSDYRGAQNSVSEIIGADLFSHPGLIRANQKMTKESGTTVDTFCRSAVACSDGNSYFFGNGKIYKRDSVGVWSTVATGVISNGQTEIISSREYNGYIYYTFLNTLGRWQIGTAWSTRDDNWNSINDGDYHPMEEVNLVLYIAGSNIISQVDNTTFSYNALDLPAPHKIKSMKAYKTSLLMGSIIEDNVVGCKIFRWNTWSDSYSSEDYVPEVGVNCFLSFDNLIVISAGVKGNLYYYNGSELELFKKIKGDYRGSNKAVVNPNATLNFNNIPLFGLSNVSGNPSKLGVYALGRANRNYNTILSLDFPLSVGTSDIEIGAIISAEDIFLVSWKSGSTYGVDVLDLTKKQDVEITFRKVIADRMKSLTFGKIQVGYNYELPTDTDIKIYVGVNGDDPNNNEITNTTHDERLNLIETDIDVNDAVVVQPKIKMIAKDNNAPEVEQINLNIK